MLDAADGIVAEFDPPDEDAVYTRYLETCKRLSVEPVPQDRAAKLIAEWSAVLAARQRQPPLHYR